MAATQRQKALRRLPALAHYSTTHDVASLSAILRRPAEWGGSDADRLFAGNGEIAAQYRPGAGITAGRRFASWRNSNTVRPRSGLLPPAPPAMSCQYQLTEKDAAPGFAGEPTGAVARASNTRYGLIPASRLALGQSAHRAERCSRW